MLPMLILRIDEGDERQYENYVIVHCTLVGRLLGNVIARAFQIRNLISCFLIASISVVIPHVNIYNFLFLF